MEPVQHNQSHSIHWPFTHPVACKHIHIQLIICSYIVITTGACYHTTVKCESICKVLTPNMSPKHITMGSMTGGWGWGGVCRGGGQCAGDSNLTTCTTPKWSRSESSFVIFADGCKFLPFFKNSPSSSIRLSSPSLCLNCLNAVQC